MEGPERCLVPSQALLPSHQVAATLTLPFDVVKTQRQIALGAVEAMRGERG